MAGIRTNFSVSAYTVTEQTKARVLRESDNASMGQEPLRDETSAVAEISRDGMKSYKESLFRSAVAGLRQSENGKGVILTDYDTLIGSKMPSIYGEKDANGEYARNFFSVSETASNLLKVYEGLYDEIVQGHEAGTREVYVEDETAESGYRKLSMDEEIAELDKAYENYVNRYASRHDKSIIDALSAHAKRVTELSSGRAGIANAAAPILENKAKSVVPKNFRQSMLQAAKDFAAQYRANRVFG